MLLSPAELHDVIQNGLEYWAMDTVDKARARIRTTIPPACEAHSRHLRNLAALRKTTRPATAEINEQRAEFLEDQPKPILHLLATLAEDAAASTNPMKDGPTAASAETT